MPTTINGVYATVLPPPPPAMTPAVTLPAVEESTPDMPQLESVRSTRPYLFSPFYLLFLALCLSLFFLLPFFVGTASATTGCNKHALWSTVAAAAQEHGSGRVWAHCTRYAGNAVHVITTC